MYARGREFMPVIYEDSLEEAYLRLEPKKITDFNHKNEVLEPIRKTWLATVDDVKTRILMLNEEIIIPELSF